ncbi:MULTISPECIES: Smr/MutS family protein [Rhizobium/Agrobacterium group]|uniref:Smr/MutS family protein n=1 Tax=Rhizobium/Agrobacterium group TaxID=227290 RepID=UPI0006B9BD73|nr:MULTISPECIES: Smr/MutS family protein [Rhizobium/Agrobacterium group]AOG11695.1 smr domain protein [Agrobacterium sp. RAC06]KPF57679.1 DNA mismatch repair protein MutS [Rhizobium sp. AAP116]MDM7982183.1 Smr/MutS family protein [Rhizobium sp.]MDM8015385.1 Smr/MutS family protein [Rhizobium sp.]
MSGGPKLNPEDRILWGKVARSTRPMPGRMEDLLSFEEQFETPVEEKDVPALNRTAISSLSASTDPDRKSAPRIHHPLEKPVKRKLSRGHLALEARIDLHGLIQSEAHGMLLDFLIRAHDRGLRHVLVITGKGSSLGSEGALKRAVPLWFSLPEFRFLISSYEPAARQHGGEGALYVRLARRGQER